MGVVSLISVTFASIHTQTKCFNNHKCTTAQTNHLVKPAIDEPFPCFAKKKILVLPMESGGVKLLPFFIRESHLSAAKAVIMF